MNLTEAAKRTLRAEELGPENDMGTPELTAKFKTATPGESPISEERAPIEFDQKISSDDLKKMSFVRVDRMGIMDEYFSKRYNTYVTINTKTNKVNNIYRKGSSTSAAIREDVEGLFAVVDDDDPNHVILKGPKGKSYAECLAFMKDCNFNNVDLRRVNSDGTLGKMCSWVEEGTTRLTEASENIYYKNPSESPEAAKNFPLFVKLKDVS